MTEQAGEDVRSPKRRKVFEESSDNSPRNEKSLPASLTKSITPPPKSGGTCTRTQDKTGTSINNDPPAKVKVVPSPFQLTHIRDLPPSSGGNVHAVRLKDVLGEPLIRECWQFNYLHDVDFIMSQFDEDVRALVKVKIVHGSWKREAPNRIRIDEACSRYPNVQAVTAYMPEPFGTHHSKMMILLRHDDLAQIVIHTANMIPGDWANMCQAVWRSPLLPLLNEKEKWKPTAGSSHGSGARFKRDLMTYLGAYGPSKTGPLIEQLKDYDFSEIKAMLVASIPSKQKSEDIVSSEKSTLWGWPALKDILRNVPMEGEKEDGRTKKKPHIVVQISSIATLGQSDKWLKGTFIDSLSTTQNSSKRKSSSPKHSIIFPTPDEIRRSLNGYASGGSIHMKLQSAAQQKQLQYLKPYLCHWAGDASDSVNPFKKRELGQLETVQKPREAGRRRAAPHIKTYIRFTDTDMSRIDWAMITSANLSTQAWGAALNGNGEVRICSWEIGVMVWPGLYSDEPNSATTEMVPSFQSDLPENTELEASSTSGNSQVRTIVGFRMPYDLPLRPYGVEDIPWCATAAHTEPDWMGQTWEEG